MRILTRYVLKEFLVPFVYCLTGFLSIYVLFDLFGSFSRMRNAHISFGDALLYFCAYLAPYFHYIVPPLTVREDIMIIPPSCVR